MTRHIHADVMIAYANDKSVIIECRQTPGESWFEVRDPCWTSTVEYRIKPNKKIDLWQYVVSFPNQIRPCLTPGFYMTAQEAADANSCKVLFKADWTRISIEVP